MGVPIPLAANEHMIKVNNIEIDGLNTFTPDMEAHDDEFGVFGNPAMQHLRCAIGKTLKLEGKALVDSQSGQPDPGQAECERLANLAGISAIGLFEIIPPLGDAVSFYGTVKMDGGGGAFKEARKWACTVTRTGADAS